MRAKRPEDKSELSLRQGFFGPGDARAAHRSMIERVFGSDDTLSDGDEPAVWRTFALYDKTGGCVGGAEARVLAFELDGRPERLTGLRRVGIDEAWRGLGLLDAILTPAVRWCESQTPAPCLLYAERPELYERFGFAQRPQHRFAGSPPVPCLAPPARRLDARSSEDRALLFRLLEGRAGVSAQCALVGAPDLVLHNLRASSDLAAAYAEHLDAAIIYVAADDDLTLVDVVAARIPPMSALVATLGLRPGTITTLFPPDRIDWVGRPIKDDTGLMSRGPLPAALLRPFMLPPTSEF